MVPKSKPPRKKPATRAATPKRRRAKPAPPPIPDRRAMEGFLAGLGDKGGDDALRTAQNLMYDAWETTTKRQRVALARKALKTSPLCADAYVLLAEETARSLPEALYIYRQGVEAGELAVGERAFKEDVGHFWGFLDTRPYMRARAGLAEALWLAGEHDEAIIHYRDLLRLNPNDNQGLRYVLASCYQELERHDALDALLDDYPDDAAASWAYTRALAAFRRTGDSTESRGLLAAAFKSNGHVPAFLLGHRNPPRYRHDYITLGGEDEAAEYARDFGAGWAPGAVAWLRDAAPPHPRPKRRRSGP